VAEITAPAPPPEPGDYQRPYVTYGRAAQTEADQGPGWAYATPPVTQTVRPEDFQRPLMTEGRQAPYPKAPGPLDGHTYAADMETR
jgi:hypothetical protein